VEMLHQTEHAATYVTAFTSTQSSNLNGRWDTNNFLDTHALESLSLKPPVTPGSLYAYVN